MEFSWLRSEDRRVGWPMRFRSESATWQVSLILLALGSPLFVVIAAFIKLDSKGPVVFRQERIGRYGKPFRMFKFRTMREGALPYDYSPRAAEVLELHAWAVSFAAPVWMNCPNSLTS